MQLNKCLLCLSRRMIMSILFESHNSWTLLSRKKLFLSLRTKQRTKGFLRPLLVQNFRGVTWWWTNNFIVVSLFRLPMSQKDTNLIWWQTKTDHNYNFSFTYISAFLLVWREKIAKQGDDKNIPATSNLGSLYPDLPVSETIALLF